MAVGGGPPMVGGGPLSGAGHLPLSGGGRWSSRRRS
jgi:hypothetical protein